MKEIIKLKNCGYKIKAQNGNILFKHSHSSEITLSTKKEIQQCIDAIKDNKVEALEYLKLSEKIKIFLKILKKHKSYSKT